MPVAAFRHPAPFAALALAALLAGCASPPQIVRWQPPPAAATPTGANTLDAGRAYADAARNAYQQAVADHVAAQGSLANGLLGTGALTTLLAASTAHRDAVLGTAFLGGTAYAYGNMNLSKQRALVHLAGVEALNCAKRAVAPLGMPVTEMDALNGQLTMLDSQLRAMNTTRGAVRTALTAELRDNPAAAPTVAAADAAMAAATSAAEAAKPVQASARRLAVQARSASDQLMQAVDRIDAAIVRATMDTLPDLSAVPKVIGGLAGFAASFAPGAGLDTLINDALAKRSQADAKAQSGGLKTTDGGTDAVGDKQKAARPAGLDELVKATNQLANATDALMQTVDALKSRVDAHETSLVADQLRDCGIGDIAFPLRASSDKMVFVPGTAATKTIALSGGTKPYVVELQGSSVDGLTLKAPAPFESRVQVSITDKVKAQTLSLLVMDSSNPMKTIDLPIEIGAQKAEDNEAKKPNSESGGTGGGQTPPDSLGALADRLNSLGQYRVNDNLLLRNSATFNAKPGDTTLTVKLRCDPVPKDNTGKITVEAARQQLAKAVGLASDAPLARQMRIELPDNCRKAG